MVPQGTVDVVSQCFLGLTFPSKCPQNINKLLQIRQETDNTMVLYKIYFATNLLVMSTKIFCEKNFINQNHTDK